MVWMSQNAFFNYDLDILYYIDSLLNNPAHTVWYFLVGMLFVVLYEYIPFEHSAIWFHTTMA